MLKSKLTAAVLVALAVGYSSAYAASAPQDAQNNPDQGADTTKAKRLEAVTVTGSLIPQTQVETSTPVTTITAQDLKVKGFGSVAEALQQSSFATGAVQGPNASGGFTQTAQTLSIFGLPVGYVKYLIDGRPMGNFPALYNGSDAFNNLASIPAEMVDHIDILPGGQSSIYGSDAIAGVINIVLKKKLDAPVLDVRYGWHTGGGGAERRVYLADSFQFGNFNIMGGVQFLSAQPIWAGDRGLTRQFFTQGTSVPVASRNELVTSATKRTNPYYDPNVLNPGVGCDNVSSLFQGQNARQFRTNNGYYCGSFNTPSYATETSDQKTANLYTHATYDINDSTQLYGDFLYNYDEQKFLSGSNFMFWSTSLNYGAIFDPKLNDLVNLQHAFSPEEVGGFKNIMDKNYENSYMLTLGGKGTFGHSNWDWDLAFTHSDDQTISRGFQRFNDQIEDYFQNNVLGPDLGPGPNGFEQFSPNYNAFFQPISNADFRTFTGYTTTRAKTWDNMLRGQITNASLFTLPGGDAGLALVAEGGNQGWNYAPDARFLDGSIWGTTDVQGAGHRSRWATTAEMSMPVFSMLTVDVSGRYDDYSVLNQHVKHGTYNIGLEFRPWEMLLLRGKYGTAFKAPTLSDEFQGASGYFSTVTDYTNCARDGFLPGNTDDCIQKYSNAQFQGQNSGNPALKPITAKVWNYGFVVAPLPQMSISVDYYHYDISNEVSPQSSDLLARREYECRTGILDINSPTCQNAIDSIVRLAPTDADHLGLIDTISTPKVNVAKEQMNALAANFNYLQDIGRFGKLVFNASYTDILKHDLTQFPGDPVIDELRDPTFSTDFKTKANASITWALDRWTATAYVNRYGSTPNFAATQNGYDSKGAGKLPPWMIYNASVSYNPLDNLTLSFIVNNVFNKMPPLDRSYAGTSGAPYDVTNYNVNGRGMYLQATYKFGKAN